MATRVFDTLAEWTALDDAALDARIKLATGKPPDASQRARARRLFAAALETPGGLKVQTIHAFCTRLLHQFPFEADVAARFEVLDEATTAQLLNQLTLVVLLEGATAPDSLLGKALEVAIAAAADTTFKEVDRGNDHQSATRHEVDHRAGGVQQAIDELTRTLICPATPSPPSKRISFVASPTWPRKANDRVDSNISAGSKTDKERAHSLSAAPALFRTRKASRLSRRVFYQCAHAAYSIVTKKDCRRRPTIGYASQS